ncbi:hypothetical protein J7384_16705 [Endozoicomonas sp. G2_1]|uniref:hypothetical protein n=1 Tax=Endozoicomonas sp. G2_1 TaxID=2821091 RepID=UPI001ADA0EC3|nr:hypothetical protein [Endozoicomonas sp. G2_1]MBO9492003.1 hypothetical protein [Endozoicomonas sp. G2_1]
MSISFQAQSLDRFALIFPICHPFNVKFNKPILTNLSLDIDLSISWCDSLIHLNQLALLCKTDEQNLFVNNMVKVAKEFV